MQLKTGSLFNRGLKPAVFSVRENEVSGTEWVRDGFDISYFKSQLRKEYTNRRYYELQFSYTFRHEKDKVFFAHSYPYTYSDLLGYYNRLSVNPERSQYISRKTLCTTLAGNSCDVLTITSNSLQKRAYRKGVVFMARQHPGEPQGSYVMQGIIDFLTSQSEEAEFLRTHCIFKVFPMLNVDGVVLGNYRCGLEGNDLNRKWNKPNKRQHPSVYFSKKYIKGFSKERQIILICDLHGHSRKQGSFVYGCTYSSQLKAIERIFALLLSKLNKCVQYPSCSFRVERARDKTARVSLWRELHINWVYTYESSFFGQDGRHFGISDYLDFGVKVCQTLGQLLADMTKIKLTQQDDVPPMQKKLLEELTKMPDTDDQDIGSDSSPSEDELSDEEYVKLFPAKSLTAKQRQVLNKAQQPQKKQNMRASLAVGQKTEQRSDSQREGAQQQQRVLSYSNVHESKNLNSFTSPNRGKSNYNSFQSKNNLRANCKLPRQGSVQLDPLEAQRPDKEKDDCRALNKTMMVDKAIQTDEHIYRQWLIQVGKAKRQQQDGLALYSYTPHKSTLSKSQSHNQPAANFLIKNSHNEPEDKYRVESIDILKHKKNNQYYQKKQMTGSTSLLPLIYK